jgi:hypothetical protein
MEDKMLDVRTKINIEEKTIDDSFSTTKYTAGRIKRGGLSLLHYLAKNIMDNAAYHKVESVKLDFSDHYEVNSLGSDFKKFLEESIDNFSTLNKNAQEFYYTEISMIIKVLGVYGYITIESENNSTFISITRKGLDRIDPFIESNYLQYMNGSM